MPFPAKKQVIFLCHVINGDGVSVYPSKMEVITNMTIKDLMEVDGCTHSVRRIKSSLGMVFYYQHFIPNGSAIAKPLFALTYGQKRRGKSAKDSQGVYCKLAPADWVVDFNEPFILSVDVSSDELGVVLSQVPKGESKARPVAFASKTLSVSQRRYPAHRLVKNSAIG